MIICIYIYIERERDTGVCKINTHLDGARSVSSPADGDGLQQALHRKGTPGIANAYYAIDG